MLYGYCGSGHFGPLQATSGHFGLQATLQRSATSFATSMQSPSDPARIQLLAAFRTAYSRFESQVQLAVRESLGDPVVFERLGDDLDQFSSSVESHINVFEGNEGSIITTKILILKSEVQVAHRQSLDMSHHGRPVFIECDDGLEGCVIAIDGDRLELLSEPFEGGFGAGDLLGARKESISFRRLRTDETRSPKMAASSEFI